MNDYKDIFHILIKIHYESTFEKVVLQVTNKVLWAQLLLCFQAIWTLVNTGKIRRQFSYGQLNV